MSFYLSIPFIGEPYTTPIISSSGYSNTSYASNMSNQPNQVMADEQRAKEAAEAARRAEAARAAANDAEAIRQQQQQLLDAATSTYRIEAVSNLKLLDIWRDHPEAWFIKIEAIFTANRITSDATRFSTSSGR